MDILRIFYLPRFILICRPMDNMGDIDQFHIIFIVFTFQAQRQNCRRIKGGKAGNPKLHRFSSKPYTVSVRLAAP